MSAVFFSDDDDGYEQWLRDHPAGFVVNTRRSPTARYINLHRVRCSHVSVLQAGYSRWTSGGYSKVCADSARELDEWCRDRVGALPGRGCVCMQ
jgi:hypothetical protein